MMIVCFRPDPDRPRSAAGQSRRLVPVEFNQLLSGSNAACSPSAIRAQRLPPFSFAMDGTNRER